MSHVIEIEAKKSLLFGMEWVVLSDLKKDLKKYRSEIGASHFCKVSSIDEFSFPVGFVKNSDRLTVKGKVYSAAAALASFPDLPPALVFLYDNPADPDATFFIGMKAGQPLPGFDLVVKSKAEFEEALSNFAQANPNQEIRTAGKTRYLEVSTEMTLLMLLDAAEYEKSTLVVPFSAVDPNMAALVIIILAIVSGGGYYGYSQYRASQIRLAQQRAAANANQTVDPNVAYLTSLDSLKSQTGVPLKGAIATIKSILAKVPHQLAGYSVNAIDCTSNNCVVTWKQEPQPKDGTMDQFAAQKPDYFETVNYELTGDQITNSIEEKVTASPIILKDLPTFTDFLVKTGSQFQKLKTLGMTFQIGAASPFGLPPNVQASQVKKLITSGTISLSGPYYLFEGLDFLPANISLETLKISVTEKDVNFNASGKYYVQNAQ